MVPPHRQHEHRGALLCAPSGNKWKDRLASVSLSDQQVAAAILRCSWALAVRCKTAGFIPSIGKRHADGQD
jgi:hypothetical protein